MLTWLALAVRAFGVYALAKAVLRSVDLGHLLIWMHEAGSRDLQTASDIDSSNLAITKLNLMLAASADDGRSALVWDLTLHAVGWFLLGCFCWTYCTRFARLFLRDIPGTSIES